MTEARAVVHAKSYVVIGLLKINEYGIHTGGPWFPFRPGLPGSPGSPFEGE